MACARTRSECGGYLRLRCVLLGIGVLFASSLCEKPAWAAPDLARVAEVEGVDPVDVDDAFTPSFEPLPVPLSRDERASAVFLNRALSFYAAQERYRRRLEGGISIVSGALLVGTGALLLAGADTAGDRYAAGAASLLGAAFAVGGIARLTLPSELEELRVNYVGWRADGRAPTWVSVNRALRSWRGIAGRERGLRKVTGWAGVLLGGAFGVLGAVSAFDEPIDRTYAISLGLMSISLATLGTRLLTTETPAEAGYRAWLVYVQPLPPVDSLKAGFGGTRAGALPVGGGMVGVRGAL
jgi:hypothetical protein